MPGMTPSTSAWESIALRVRSCTTAIVRLSVQRMVLVVIYDNFDTEVSLDFVDHSVHTCMVVGDSSRNHIMYFYYYIDY